MTADADILSAQPPRADAAGGVVRCAHCEQIVPAGLVEPEAQQQFCCGGCRAVYQMLHTCGLDSYYRLREAAQATPTPARVSGKSFESFDSQTFHDLYVLHGTDGTATTDLALEGVTCAACVWLVERLPRVLDGVIDARLSLREAIVRVRWDAGKLKLSRIARTLDSLGYTPHPARGQDARQLHRAETRKRIIHLGIAGAIMGNTMLLGFALYAGDAGHMEGQFRMFFRWISAAMGMVSLAWPGAVFFRSAWAAIRTRTTNIDVPIALALLAGGVAGLINVILSRGAIYFDSLTVLVFLLLVGRFIQYRQQRRADDAVGLLFSLTPSSCRIVLSSRQKEQSHEDTKGRSKHEEDIGQDLSSSCSSSSLRAFVAPSSLNDEQVIEAPVEALTVDDLIEVRPGELFPADGLVETGRSTVNQALLTGESMPTNIDAGSAVHAGSQNIASVVRVRVSKVGRDTRLAQLMRLIERGVQDKPPIVQFADKVGGWFIIAVSIAAAAVFAYWSRFSVVQAIDYSVALLIVTCPCVLGLATPLTLAIAIGRLARRDILVKSGAALERLSRGGSLLLDKTGTITEGHLRLIKWIGDTSVQPAVAELERRSNHPVGRALHQALAGQRVDGQATEVVERGDGGISGMANGVSLLVGSPRYMKRHEFLIDDDLSAAVNELEQEAISAVIIAVDGKAVAAAGLGDQIRSDSAAAIASLNQLGWRAEILSGDAPDVVAAVAKVVGIDPQAAHGAMTPEEKLEVVRNPGISPIVTRASRPCWRRSHGRDARVTDVVSLGTIPGQAQTRVSVPPNAVVMVGDGVNDSAALAAADVGIAVHGGAEASLAAADVYVARAGLSPLVDLIESSRLAMRVIRRNLLISLCYNLLAGTLAAMGMMSPLIAAIIMPVSSATVLSLAATSIGRDGRRQSWK